MNVDLIKALDARAAESSRSEKSEGDGEFPEVFASSLSEGEEPSAAEGGPQPSEEDAPAQAGADAKQTDEVAARSEEEDEAQAEAAAESGAVGGERGALTDRARLQADEAALSAERQAQLADELAARQVAESGEIEGEEVLDDERAREVIAQLEAEGVTVADGDEASATVEAATVGAVASGVPQAAAGVAETNAALDEVPASSSAGDREIELAAAAAAEERAASDEEHASREEARRNPDEALFERAAEGSSSAEVDPNLRQAVANEQAAQRAPEVTAIDGAPAVASPVAGQVTETTTTATPGSPQPVAASEAISVQTEWLATRGGGTARMVLHPAELGEIAIRVTLRGGAVDVVMVAQEAVAQGVAEEQSERLAQAFANRDLRLENFEVRRGAADELADGGAGAFAESEAEREGRSGEEDGGRSRGRTSEAGDEAEVPMVTPRILTRAPETGVDLRI